MNRGHKVTRIVFGNAEGKIPEQKLPELILKATENPLTTKKKETEKKVILFNPASTAKEYRPKINSLVRKKFRKKFSDAIKEVLNENRNQPVPFLRGRRRSRVGNAFNVAINGTTINHKDDRQMPLQELQELSLFKVNKGSDLQIFENEAIKRTRNFFPEKSTTKRSVVYFNNQSSVAEYSFRAIDKETEIGRGRVTERHRSQDDDGQITLPNYRKRILSKYTKHLD